MDLSNWNSLSTHTQRYLILEAFDNNRWRKDWCEDFERYLQNHANLDIVIEFIKVSADRYKTHRRYGAKAIQEEMRWLTYRRDNDQQFKVNNNYTSSVCRLAMLMFPDELIGFFKPRNRLGQDAKVETTN